MVVRNILENINNVYKFESEQLGEHIGGFGAGEVRGNVVVYYNPQN